LAVPHGQPWIDRRDKTICNGLIDSGSGATTLTTQLAPGASPSIRAEWLWRQGRVARITLRAAQSTESFRRGVHAGVALYS
jgi:hypothetical protein